jgi:putative hydrolase of the HAD superfamily
MTADGALGLIVDWGGVLTTPVDESFTVFIEREDIDAELFKSTMGRMHNEDGSALHRVEIGAIRREEFEEELAAEFRTTEGGPVAADGLLARMFGHGRKNEPMRSLVSAARVRGWRTALLSNSWGNPYDEVDLADLLGTVLLSERLGVRKPDPAAYLIAADSLRLPPTACIFVDDLRRNTLAADAVGMTGFQYRPGSEARLDETLRLRERP